MPDVTVIDTGGSLQGHIHRAMVTSKFDKNDREFIPEGVIEDMVQENVVRQALGEERRSPHDSDTPSTQPVINYIMAHAKIVFAIAAWSIYPQEMRNAMQVLHAANISDRSLPIEEETMRHEIDRVRQQLRSEHVGNTPHQDVWGTWKIAKFCESQWSFLVPVFSRSTFTHDLQQQAIIPFLAKDVEHDEGAFGRVTMFQVHRNHLIDRTNPQFQCPEFVAVKEIPSTKKDRHHIASTWGQEARALQKMNLLRQPHIVQFHTSFRRGIPGAQDHYLMLEWASGGNLRNLWRSLHRPCLSEELIKATACQLLGLAKAINKAHYPPTGPNFRHGDLKPENILWFKSETGNGIGMLKIGDWGTAKQHFRVTEMRSNRTTSKWGTRRYEPPEEASGEGTKLCVPGHSGKKRSRLYDMWAFGCIMLEFLIWLMYGPEEQDRFDQDIVIDSAENARFYVIKEDANGKPVAKVHDVVSKWMDHMAKDPICAPGSTALGGLLEVVQTRLLVVKLPERLGTTVIESPSEDTTPVYGAMSNDDASSLHSAEADPYVHSTVPTFKFDEAESSKNRVSTEAQAPPEPVPRAPGGSGRERARASDLMNYFYEIEREDDDTYWFSGQPDPPQGPYVDDIRHNMKDQLLAIRTTERVSVS